MTGISIPELLEQTGMSATELLHCIESTIEQQGIGDHLPLATEWIIGHLRVLARLEGAAPTGLLH